MIATFLHLLAIPVSVFLVWAYAREDADLLAAAAGAFMVWNVLELVT